MLHIKDYFQRLKLIVQPEHALNAVIFSIILVVIAVSFFAARYPVSSEQYFKIQKLAIQQSFPETQNMAHLMLMQDEICVVDFYRLMHAQHYESSRIQTYPAEAQDDE